VPLRITSSADDPEFAVPGGIYPYVGSSVSAAELREIVHDYGYAAVPARNGVKLAGEVLDTLADPARYVPGAAADNGMDSLFSNYHDWLERQRHAKVPAILTDSDRIKKDERGRLRDALQRWTDISDPVLAVLPLDSWWLKGGLNILIEEARSAHRPVALVLHSFFNALEESRAVAGLLKFLVAMEGIPVVLLRCDISGVGAVAYGAQAAFIGFSASLRHGPMPRRAAGDKDKDRDLSPHVFVPALHGYFKASQLPAFARAGGPDLLACYDQVCQGESLLRLSRLAEADPRSAREQAYRHNLASHERVAQTVFRSAEPKDAWWELCRSGADTAASLIEGGVILTIAPWLRQWLERGSPAHEPVRLR
jgi:hypothetical protein